MTDSPQTIVGLGIAEVIGSRRDYLLQLAAEHGAYNVRVFGSVVRGEAGITSDLDLLVDWDYGKISAWGGIDLKLVLERVLGRPVDVVSANSLHWAIRDHILQEAISL